MDNSDKVKEVLLFQVNRSIVNFYKNHLTMIEDLKREHQAMLKKVEKKTSKEFSESIDTFDNDKYNYIRKKTLDHGNDIIRELEQNLDKLEIRIK
jgi:polyhydroxyalkanoate synthesis regulator phasin